MAAYTKLEDKVNNRKIQVESAVRDGAGKNIENNYAKQDGYYQGLTAGLSENFNTNLSIDDNSAYLFRTSGGALEITNNDRLKSVIGGTIVMNQVAINGDFSNGTDKWDAIGGTATTSNNELTYTSDLTLLTYVNYKLFHTVSAIPNHKYFVSFAYKSNANFNASATPLVPHVACAASETYVRKIKICSGVTNPANNDWYFYNYTNPKTEAWVLNLKEVEVIDLTQMFGSAIANYINTLETNNAGAGIAFVKQFLPNDYYAYTATPYFVNVKTAGKKVVGFNAYNNNTGTAKLLGGNVYQITGTYTNLSYVNILGKSETITPDGNGKFTPTYNGTLTVEGGSTDTCIHLVWDGERDGEFEEYKETTYPIEDVELKGFLKLDSNNNFYNDGDEYKSDGTIVRKYAVDTVVNIPQFNQVIGSIATQTTDYGITITNNGDGSYTITGQNTSSANKYVAIGFNYGGSVPSGHKIFYQINNSNIGIGLVNAGNGKGLTYTNNISTTDDIYSLHLRIDANLDATNGITISPFVIDLTELFGAGNEPLTVENFKTIFPNNYYSSKLATANADGAVKCNYLTADYTNYLYKTLSETSTETAIPFTENQIVDNWGTEEFIDTRDIKVLVGNKTEYLPNLKAKLEVAPDSPENNGYYVMKRDSGVNSYSLLSSYLEPKPFTLIKKIITGYSLLASEPADWSTNYTDYFKNTGTADNPTYVQLTELETFTTNTYYSYNSASVSVAPAQINLSANTKEIIIKATTKDTDCSAYWLKPFIGYTPEPALYSAVLKYASAFTTAQAYTLYATFTGPLHIISENICKASEMFNISSSKIEINPYAYSNQFNRVYSNITEISYISFNAGNVPGNVTIEFYAR